jgi:hypothetical protein
MAMDKAADAQEGQDAPALNRGLLPCVIGSPAAGCSTA